MEREKKICFIVWARSGRYLDECLLYLDRLEVPDGYETELLTVTDEPSAAAAYNAAMASSDARYKVYLHEDVLLQNRSLIADILRVFAEDPKIGLIGLVGAQHLAKDGIFCHRDRCGSAYGCAGSAGEVEALDADQKQALDVEAVDGSLMITSQDIRWRDDLFAGQDFYDTAQCLAFLRRGFRVVVPPQETAWAIHLAEGRQAGCAERERQALLREYADFFAQKTELRVLFFHSDLIGMTGLPIGFLELGHDLTMDEERIRLAQKEEEETVRIADRLEEGHYDLVVTYDFCRSVAEACREKQTPYLAWVFDSPLKETYAPEAAYDTSHLAVFDRVQFARLQKERVAHLHYTPLASDVALFGSAVITKEEERQYRSDISFVGQLYDSDVYGDLVREAPPEIREAMERAVSPLCVWDGKTGIYGRAGRDVLDYLVSAQNKYDWPMYGMEPDFFCETVLSYKMNELERIETLNRLAERYPVTLYTRSAVTERLQNVTVRSRVNYISEMPKVFYLSRINLNITARSIVSGLPQRIWDVMACGGFLLTNYQPEIEEYFTPGKELEVFHDLDELIEKAGYYLRHEKKRVEIAMRGYQAVKDSARYSRRLAPILEQIFPGGRTR